MYRKGCRTNAVAGTHQRQYLDLLGMRRHVQANGIGNYNDHGQAKKNNENGNCGLPQFHHPSQSLQPFIIKLGNFNTINGIAEKQSIR